MKNIKNYCLIILAFLFSLSFVKTSFADSWVDDNGKWKYEEGGNFVANDWRELDGSIYYFDSEGHMATELIKIGKYYHMFEENGRPVSRNTDFWWKNRSYSIVSRGKVQGLETDMNDSEYFQFIIELRAKRAEENAKKAAEAAYNAGDPTVLESIAATMETVELTEQEKRLLAAEEYKLKQKAEAEAAKEAAKYALYSLEDRNKLLVASRNGNDEASATASLMAEMVNQLTARKAGIVEGLKAIMLNNPSALNIEGTIEDYRNFLKEFTPEIDTSCRDIRTRLGLDNTRFVLMKDKFTQVLDHEVDSLRTMILGLIK